MWTLECCRPLGVAAPADLTAREGTGCGLGLSSSRFLRAWRWGSFQMYPHSHWVVHNLCHTSSQNLLVSLSTPLEQPTKQSLPLTTQNIFRIYPGPSRQKRRQVTSATLSSYKNAFSQRYLSLSQETSSKFYFLQLTTL